MPPSSDQCTHTRMNRGSPVFVVSSLEGDGTTLPAIRPCLTTDMLSISFLQQSTWSGL